MCPLEEMNWYLTCEETKTSTGFPFDLFENLKHKGSFQHLKLLSSSVMVYHKWSLMLWNEETASVVTLHRSDSFRSWRRFSKSRRIWIQSVDIIIKDPGATSDHKVAALYLLRYSWSARGYSFDTAQVVQLSGKLFSIQFFKTPKLSINVFHYLLFFVFVFQHYWKLIFPLGNLQLPNITLSNNKNLTLCWRNIILMFFRLF